MNQRKSALNFGHLPWELRDQIYSYYFAPKYILARFHRKVAECWKLDLGLLVASKAIHEEAIAVLYYGNSFQLRPKIRGNGVSPVAPGKRGWGLMRHIELCVEMGDWYHGNPPQLRDGNKHARFVEGCFFKMSQPPETLRLTLEFKIDGRHLLQELQLLGELRQLRSCKNVYVGLESEVPKDYDEARYRSVRPWFFKPPTLTWARDELEKILTSRLGPSSRSEDEKTYFLKFCPLDCEENGYSTVGFCKDEYHEGESDVFVESFEIVREMEEVESAIGDIRFLCAEP